MFVIPTGTDAPLYHWPAATVAVMVLNVALFFAVPPGAGADSVDDEGDAVAATPSAFERYALALGDGLHPTQWLTHNFLHNDLVHLAGNLVFLWAFGLVVEGKLGAPRFLLLYAAVGTLHGATVQALLLRSGLVGHAAGASAVVFGLLAACMVWAPRNELNCTAVFLIGFRVLVFHWDLYYTTVAAFYIGEQLLWLAVYGLAAGRVMVSELGHLSGALWGTALAVALVKLRWVDCEGWDVFSVLARRRQLARDWEARGASLDRNKAALRKSVKATARDRAAGPGPDAEADPAALAAAAVAKVRKRIEAGDIPAALAAYDRSARTLVAWPPQPDLLGIIKALHAAGAEADSIPLMRDHCRYFPEASARLRLKLAQVLLRDRRRPAAALCVLAEIPAGALPPDLDAVRRSLARQAEQMREDGVLELEGDD